MNQSAPSHLQPPHQQPQPLRAGRSIRGVIVSILGISMLGALGACSGVSQLTQERVAQSETSVQQAQQTVGRSEHGATQLQQATDKLNMAKNALAKGEQQEAERAAAQAHLYAELAVAKSQSADARKAADEVLASLETLRQETERPAPTQGTERPTQP